MDQIQYDIMCYLRDCPAHIATSTKMKSAVSGMPTDAKVRRNLLDRMVAHGYLMCSDDRQRLYYLSDYGRSLVYRP